MTANLEQRAREMEPCPNPWCEAEERVGDYQPVVRLHHFGNYRVVCTSCVLEGPLRPNEVEAIAAWNTRPESAQPASSGWKGLATAPRDGSTIVATGLDCGRGPKRHVALVYYDEDRGGFYDRAESDDNYCYLTHWSPAAIPSFSSLPSPPEPAAPELG